MLPLKFDDNRRRIEAMSSAYVERFLIGLLVPNVALGGHPAVTGSLLGFGMSVPSAIITRTYVPILGLGTVAGLAAGLVTQAVAD
jgi:hypothetical protein